LAYQNLSGDSRGGFGNQAISQILAQGQAQVFWHTGRWAPGDKARRL
jgi:hypothetical protein